MAEHIRKIDAEPGTASSSDKDMEEMAQFFVSFHRQPQIDYTDRFRILVNKTDSRASEEKPSERVQSETDAVPSPNTIMCPKCGAPMVLRKAAKGPKTGEEFYGCSKFPTCWGIVNIGKAP